MFSKNKIIFSTIDSTQIEAKRIIDKVLKNKDDDLIISGLSLIAEIMTSGVTRKKNIQWYSPKGNLYLTHIININQKNYNLNYIPVCLLLAAFLNIKSMLTSEATVKFKWPNDMLLNNKKISGVISEKYKNFLILGIAINIAEHPLKTHNFPADSINNYIKNKINNFEEIQELGDNIIKQFYQYFYYIETNDIQVIKELWKKNAFQINQIIKLEDGKNYKFVNIGDDFEMEVEDQDGKKHYKFSDEILCS